MKDSRAIEDGGYVRDIYLKQLAIRDSLPRIGVDRIGVDIQQMMTMQNTYQK